MSRLLKNKTAVITGCNKGIGKAILIKFAKENAEIVACTRKKDSEFLQFCKNLQTKYNIKIHNIFFDLEKIDEIKSSITKIKEKVKKIDIIVNNAGIIQTSLFQMTKIDDVKKIFEVNFFPFISLLNFWSNL